MWNEGIKTFLAGEALAEKVRVVLKSATVTDPPEVVAAGAGEQHIGVTEYAVESGDPVAVKLRSFPGTHEVTASKAIDIGETLYGSAAGKVSDEASGNAIGVALEAAAGDGQIIEIIDFTIMSDAAANISVADSGGFTSATTVEAALAEIYQHLKSIQGCILVPLGGITMEDGTILTKQASTVAGIAQLSDKEQVIQIPINCSAGESLGFSVPLPMDFDESADITVHVLAGKAADNDELTLDCEVYPVGVGDVGNSDIQDTAAQAITQAASELVFTCGADGLLAAPGALTVVLALGGENDGDAVYIYGVWIEYKKKLLAA